ncbi:MAG TPA: triphosphoribosyl-dephospho-CoA synthase [Methanobacteriaceae archaeon]|nr:triphosphoribosyl-dephospho-CoA synthase [Methanobacteriaceae archaeon]
MNKNYVAKCAQIASVLEVSGHPKPGNVHRTQDFEDMVFEDFLISGVVIGDYMRKAARQGSRYSDPDSWHKIGLGKIIKDSVLETDQWVKNNTNLGIIMLLTPLSAAAGMSNDLESVRYHAGKIMKATTTSDAVDLYAAINIADAGGMGDQEDLDVSSESSAQELIDNNVNMFQVLEMSAGWDMLAYELTHEFPVTFNTGYPVFSDLKNTEGINPATVQTFLTILSQYPDTLISRKYNQEKSEKVSAGAKSILDVGGILTREGRKKIQEFDQKLLSYGLNPGTTADLTASSIMVAYLSNYDNYKF